MAPATSARIIINASGAQEIRASNRDVLRKYLEHVDAGQFRNRPPCTRGKFVRA
jgi:hypothetical protein